MKNILVSKSALMAAVLLGLIVTSTSLAEDRTLAEFEKYLANKVPNFSESQIRTLAKGVDRNSDGTISTAEFANRADVYRVIIARGGFFAKKKKGPASDASTDKTPVRPAINSSAKATVLLVTANKLAAAWKPFADWKTRNGKVTKIVTVADIAKKYKAKSIQEKIRLCVREHIDNQGTRWVVLGGDSLPGGKGLVPGGHITVHAQEPRGIPTDIVYLSKTNWDADGDGIYGEWRDDQKAISYPDGSVGLGRIPVRTAADVAAFTEKVIGYEARYPETSFAKQMIYTCTVGAAYPKVRNSWDGYLSKAWTGGKVGRFFSKRHPGTKRESREAIR
jgi:hypothetical protein